MDWDKILTLLEVVHKSVNVPGTEKLRKQALTELEVLNAGVGVVKISAQAELPLTKGRLS